jgi:hypothetical protein
VSAPSVLLNGLTWEELARDRRVRRLRRGKHFRGDLRVAQREAAVAARELGCAVRMVRDDFLRSAYLWIQFTDFELPLGEPCPRCGGLEMTRTHEYYGRCSTCGASLAFLPPISGEGADSRTVQRLKRRRRRQGRIDQFTAVQLVSDPEASDSEQEVWYGRGEYLGERVLLRVVYPLRDGERQPHPDDPDDDLHFVSFWALAPYGRAVELGLDVSD